MTPQKMQSYIKVWGCQLMNCSPSSRQLKKYKIFPASRLICSPLSKQVFIISLVYLKGIISVRFNNCFFSQGYEIFRRDSVIFPETFAEISGIGKSA